MNLSIRAHDETTLQISLNDSPHPTVKNLPLCDQQVISLQQCIENYQDCMNLPNNMDALRLIGRQLFALLDRHRDLTSRWLNDAGERRLEIHTPAQARTRLQRLLLNLPWEIMACADRFLADANISYEVARRIGTPKAEPPHSRYKDMTLAFMAADPELTSGLNYEVEEQSILKATRTASNLNLWVDESGNLDSLTQRIVETGHCDMVHISCHGNYDQRRGGFVLLLEDGSYGPQNVTPEDFQNLAKHIQCLFLSSCHSARAAETPSFALQTAELGIANVVGWDGSIGDEDATMFAAEVYHSLVKAGTVPSACAIARRQLLRQHLENGRHPHWHLGRVFLAPTGGWPLIDNSKPTSPKRRGKSCHDLLDRKKSAIPVASKETFVGRRKETKRALQAFAANKVPGILLTGIGGSGKSSLAARIVHRMEPKYKAVVIYKDYSEIAILSELRQSCAAGANFDCYLSDIDKHPHLFADNLIEILEKYLNDQPVALIVDDLEQHALEPLNTSAADGRVSVKQPYKNALAGLIDAFERADTQSRLLLTSRHHFSLLSQNGQDMTERLLIIEAPDMNRAEQEKHWLALLQSGVVADGRDQSRDGELLTHIWRVCQGNPGLQDVLYQPLLKGELEALQQALQKLASYRADQAENVFPGEVDMDKYLQRIALETYHEALTDTERQCLRVLSLFDFAIPEVLLVQAGSQLGIDNPANAMQRLDNLGLLTHWQGEGLDGHVSCYGLARKIVAPLSSEDRSIIAKICAPLLWRIWFAQFLQQHGVPPTETFLESVNIIYSKHYPRNFKGELPLQSVLDQKRIAYLHRLCIQNCPAEWNVIGFDADEFIVSLEFSLSLHLFEKLKVSASALEKLTIFQWCELYKVFSEEREKFKELAVEHPQDVLSLLLQQVTGRTELLVSGYQLFFGELSADEKKKIAAMDLSGAEDQFKAGIELARTEAARAEALGKYANFLANQKHDYPGAEALYERALGADSDTANILGNYASFLTHQKRDHPRAEALYERALKADPDHANNLGNYANFLADQQHDYPRAEALYERALKADPDNVRILGNYAYFLANQKHDYPGAEALYERALGADPDNARILGNYANFLAHQKHDSPGAEALYERALGADPDNVRILGNYAYFLVDQKHDYPGAEALYERALGADPDNANILGNYASFLTHQKHDYPGAEALYERALKADPDHANNLGNYANFLAHQKHDHSRAEALYERALKADPDHANNLGNYAKFLFAANQKEQAKQCLQRAGRQPNLPSDLQIELEFYRYAHCAPYDLCPIKQQLLSGSRSIGWDLSANIKRAGEDQHPSLALLQAIALVVSGEQALEKLNQYPEWNESL